MGENCQSPSSYQGVTRAVKIEKDWGISLNIPHEPTVPKPPAKIPYIRVNMICTAVELAMTHRPKIATPDINDEIYTRASTGTLLSIKRRFILKSEEYPNAIWPSTCATLTTTSSNAPIRSLNPNDVA